MMSRLIAAMCAAGLVGLSLAASSDEREQICRPGYARAQRPPEATTEAIKRNMCRAQHPGDRWCLAEHELDHIVPLCLGGDPLSPSNLQLQPWSLARVKDDYEVLTCREYCAGKIELPEARGRFHRD